MPLERADDGLGVAELGQSTLGVFAAPPWCTNLGVDSLLDGRKCDCLCGAGGQTMVRHCVEAAFTGVPTVGVPHGESGPGVVGTANAWTGSRSGGGLGRAAAEAPAGCTRLGAGCDCT